MGSNVYDVDDSLSCITSIHEQQIAAKMTFAISKKISGQRMIAIGSR